MTSLEHYLTQYKCSINISSYDPVSGPRGDFLVEMSPEGVWSLSASSYKKEQEDTRKIEVFSETMSNPV